MENISTITRKDGTNYSVRSNRDRFFFPTEWIKFYDGLKHFQKHTFNCLISTGARINELRNVMPSDIDLDNKRIILRVTKVKAKKGEKNPRPRIIPVSSQFAKYLKKYIKDNPQDYLGILSTPAANICLKNTLQRVGITDYYMFSVHNIRKTFETWLVALDINALKITAHMGHSLGVAAQHYVSSDVFSFDEKKTMRLILGDLYQNQF